MTQPRLLDTNILLRYLTGDDPAKARRSLALLTQVDDGQEKLVTTAMVIFEVVFTLQRTYKQTPAQIQQHLLPILGLRDLQLANKPIFLQALDLYVQHRISFADAFNAAFMLHRGISEIYSFDTDFDSLPGIIRLEP